MYLSMLMQGHTSANHCQDKVVLDLVRFIILSLVSIWS